MRRRRASIWGLCCVILLWCGLVGWGLTQAQGAVAQGQASQQPAMSTAVGTVDVVPQPLQLAQEIYRETCGSCHIAIPPAVFPDQTWKEILLTQDHYQVRLPPLYNPELALAWKYLRTYSRPLQEQQAVPYRFRQSKAFRILHPRIEYPEKLTVSTCVSCHPAAPDLNFRKLTPEWEDAP